MQTNKEGVRRREGGRTQKKGKRPLLGERRQWVEQGCLHLLFAALGALVGSAELLFGVRPFAVALVAGLGILAPAVGVGAGIFYGVTGDPVSLVAVAVTLIARLLFCLYPRNGAKKAVYFAERVAYRVTVAVVAVFGTGLYRVLQGGFRFYDLFGLLLSLLATGIATLLFAGLGGEKDRLFPHSRELGVAALVLVSVFAMREVSFFGVYPSAVAAALSALLLVAHRGVSLGAVGGLLCGLCFDHRLAPAFLLCGLCFGLLEKSGRGMGVLAGGGAAALCAFFINGADGILRILPALLTAGALFLAGDSAGLVEGSPGYRAAVRSRRDAVQSAKAGEQAAGEAQLREIADAFSDLSGTFFELSNRIRRPGLSDLRHLCDKAFDKVCPTCRNRDICWGSEYHNTARTVGALGSRLHARGEVDGELIPAALAARCTQLPGILQSINEGALRLSEEALRGDKTSVIAADYAAMGRVIDEVLEDNREAFVQDVAAGERIVERLQRMGYLLETAAVCGTHHRQVILRGLRLPGRHLKLRELRQVLEQHCHFRLGNPRIKEADGMQDLIFPERRSVCSTTAKESRAKGKGEGRYCGDSVTAFAGERGYSYALLCDGMGSGNSAALTSVLSSTFLSRLLQAGSRPETALRMLNGFLAAGGAKEGESSTTVDLLELDLVSGEASLFKCGAAPTYLLRRGELTRFTSRTAPVGILDALDAERIRFQTEAGDLVIQMSDGITKGEESCPWLEEMLLTKWDGDKEKFLRMVLGRAATEGDDDLSVMLTEIAEAPAPGSAGQESAETARASA